MNWIDLSGRRDRLFVGFWLSSGSEVAAEMAGLAGFDWLLFDMEHGIGDYTSLFHQMQAVSGSSTAAIVRIADNTPAHIRRALDLGAAGIMIPHINNEQQAAVAVAAMRYEPVGIRGMSGSVRAGGYGFSYEEYYRRQSSQLLTIVQIETEQAVEAADFIAAVEGVDILFIGPADLTHAMGIPRQFDHPDFTAACTRVISACIKHNKTAGILLRDLSLAVKAAEQGFSFIAAGSDTGVLASGMKSILKVFRKGDPVL